MNPFSSEVIERLGWVLIHSLWQFAVVAIVAAVTVAILRQRAARIRYCVLVVSMTLMIFAPCLTWILIPASGWASALRVNAVETNSSLSIAPGNTSITQTEPMQSDSEVVVGSTVIEESPVLEFNEAELTRRADAQPLSELITDILHPWFSWIVGGWLIGVLLCSLRPLLGWRTMRRLRRIGISSPSDEVVAVFTRVSERLGLHRAVRVLHSALATGPMVIGYFKPVVLLPVSLVTSIPMSQLEAILAHELAHIRRHDFAINLAQTLLETLFFYHPAIWWLSRRIRIEREHCCDDLVVELFDNGVEYGRALLAIEQLQGQPTVLALGAADGSLLGRIRRITSVKTERSRVPPPWSVCLAALVLAITLSCGSYFDGRSEGGIATIEEPGLDEANAETDGLWTTEVPGGGRIQLVALSLPGKDLGLWWSPDGVPVLHVDRFPESRFVSLGLIAIRVWEPGSDRCFLNESSGRSIGNQSDFKDPLSKNNLAQFAVLGLEPSGIRESKELRIGAGFGEWTTVGEVPFEESNTAFNEINTAILVNGEEVQLQSIHDMPENETHAWATIICRAQDKLNLDFTGVAITKNGRELPNICNPSVHLSKPDGTTQLIFDAKADDIVRLVIKSRKIHWVVFDGICVEPGNRTNLKDSVETLLPDPPEPIQTDLPTGVRVKLVGVTTPTVISEEDFRRLSTIPGVVAARIVPLPTAEKPDTRQWWRGDGTTLDKPPATGEAWTVQKSWEDGRQFAFEFSGLADRDTQLDVVMFHLQPGKPRQPVVVIQTTLESDPGKRIVVASIAPNTRADSATLELRVGTAESAIVKLDTEGRRIDSLATAAHHSDSMKQIIENIELLRITQNGDKAEVWTRPINTNDALASVMFSVLDNSGKLHSSQTGYSMNNEQLTLFPNVRAETIREIHLEIRSLNHSLTFENISRKPGTTTNVSVTVAPLPMPPETIQARLPNGGTIELLGVSTPPIELLPSKDKREWWKGDGTAMDAAPIPMGSINVGASQIDGREFVFRASNLVGQIPMDVTLKERFKDGQPYKPEGNGWSRGSTHSGSINENQKDKWQVTAEHVAGPVDDADSATLEVRVGSDVTAEMLFDAKGQRSNGDSKDDVWQLAAVKKMADRVEVLRTGPHEAGFAIWTKPFSSTTEEGTLDVSLVNVKGQRLSPFTSGSDGNEEYYAFQIKPEEVDTFVVRLRPFQSVATFENVSLKPGKKCEVKVTVEPLAQPPKPIQAALPGGGSWQLLGMTQTPIDSTVTSDRSWWNGDGSLLLSPPVPRNELKLTADRPDGRLFLFRLSGRAAFYSPDIKVQFLKNEIPVKLRDGQKAWSESKTTLNPTARDSVMEFAAGPIGDADSVILNLRFTSDEKGVDTYDRSGHHVNDTGYGVPLLNVGVNRMFRSVHVLRAGPHNESFAVWTKPFDSKSEDGQVMLEVWDGRASNLTSECQPDGSEQRYSLNVKPEDVQSFAFQFYLYDTKIRIQNMALNAGALTEPKVLVDPIAWDTIGEQEARDTLSEMYQDSIKFVPAPDGLQDLHVRNLPTAGWQFFSLLTHLRAIEIQGGDLRHGSLQHLAEIPGLKSLTIAGARCLPEDLRALRQHPTLEHLDVELSTQSELADENERVHIWTHTSFAEREWIEENRKRLSKRFPDEIANRLQLEAAVLTGRGIGHLDNLTSLKWLRIANSPVSGGSLRALAELPNLQHLNIEVIAPTTETGEIFASFPSIRSIGTIEGIPDIFPQLSFSKSLEELTVSWLNDDGVDDLLQISQLKRLRLHSCELSDAGLLKLSKLDQLTELSLIAMKGTITDEGVARLRLRLPNCKGF